MNEVNSAPSVDPQDDSRARAGGAASLTSIDDVRCALCGTSLVGRRKRYRLVSPFTTMGTVTVCSVCRRAALERDTGRTAEAGLCRVALLHSTAHR